MSPMSVRLVDDYLSSLAFRSDGMTARPEIFQDSLIRSVECLELSRQKVDVEGIFARIQVVDAALPVQDRGDALVVQQAHRFDLTTEPRPVLHLTTS